MEEVNHIKDTLIAFRSAADGTYELSTKQPVEYADGYQVSIVRPEAFEQLSDNEWDRLTEYYCEYFHSRPHLGVYGGSPKFPSTV